MSTHQQQQQPRRQQPHRQCKRKSPIEQDKEEEEQKRIQRIDRLTQIVREQFSCKLWSNRAICDFIGSCTQDDEDTLLWYETVADLYNSDPQLANTLVHIALSLHYCTFEQAHFEYYLSHMPGINLVKKQRR